MKSVKGRVLIACDYPDSVYDQIAEALIRELGSMFQFTKLYTRDLPLINHKEYDAIYCMWWRTDFLERNVIPSSKLIIQLASFWSWQQKFPISPEELSKKYLARAGTISVNCPGLYQIFTSLHPHVRLNCEGVDTDLFRPYPPRNLDDRLIVGWAGSATTHSYNKGLLDIIKPSCAAVDGVQLTACVKEDNPTPFTQMPAFYQDIDVYVCASESEGTPRPILEAAASARAVISTGVGIVPLLIEHEVNGLIIQRSIPDLVHALQRMYNFRTACHEMGQANSKSIRTGKWSWSERALSYGYMFEQVCGQVN